MDQLHRLAVVVSLALAGCIGLIDGGQEYSAAEQNARRLFVERAKPALDTSCTSCHSGRYPQVAFFAGADAMTQRATLMSYKPALINLESPQASPLLHKDEHEGPALTPSQLGDLLEWLAAERDARPRPEITLKTEPFTPIPCTAGSPGDDTCPITYISLDSLVPGAQITLVAHQLPQDLYITNVAIHGGSEGVSLEHPLFVSVPQQGAPIPDSLDRFSDVKINIRAGAPSEPIGSGIAAFVGFSPSNMIAIYFKALGPYRDDGSGGTTAGGCKQLASFKANARAPFENNCASCHAGANPGATSAMDLTGIGATDDATLQNVCNQVATVINFADTETSGFYIAPNPAQATTHPFKFNGVQASFDAFKAAVDVWVQAEKASH